MHLAARLIKAPAPIIVVTRHRDHRHAGSKPAVHRIIDARKQLIPIGQPPTLLHQIPGKQDKIRLQSQTGTHPGTYALVLIHGIVRWRPAAKPTNGCRFRLRIRPDKETNWGQGLRRSGVECRLEDLPA